MTAISQRERREEGRRLKLLAIEERVRDGSLTIRQMTAEERAKHPKPAQPRPPRFQH